MSSGLVKVFHLKMFGVMRCFFFKLELGEVIKTTCCMRKFSWEQQIRKCEAEQEELEMEGKCDSATHYFSLSVSL